MEKVLIIESSGLTFQCDSVSPVIKESTDKAGMMILRGVPATILDKENGNGRPVAFGTVPINPSAARSNPSTNASMNRTGLSAAT